MAVYRILVDWSGDGDFGDANEDITADVISLETFRGRDYASQLVGRSRAGTMYAVLENSAGTYNSFNSASPIYGNILPGRKVQIQTNDSFPYTFPIVFSGTPLWTGYLDRIVSLPSVHGAHRASFRAVGALAKLNEQKVQVEVDTDVLTSVAVIAVLDAADWSATDRAIETGNSTLDWWWADDVRALQALKELEDTEAGFLWEKADGKVAFANRRFRFENANSIASQATFSDGPGATIAYSRIDQADPLREIANVIEAKVQKYTVGTLAVLWTLPYSGANSPAIGAGESRTWWASYPNPDSSTNAIAVDAWTTPAATTDYTANSQAGGGGTDHTGDIAVAVVKGAGTMKVTLTNNAAVTVYITLLQARGTPVTADDPVQIVAEDATSQTKYGRRVYPIPGPWIPDLDEGEDYAFYILAAYKDATPGLTLAVMANRNQSTMAVAETLDINERVTIVASGGSDLGINEDFMVEAIRHQIDQHRHHWTTFDLSPVSGFSGFWVLGVSELGVSTRVAY